MDPLKKKELEERVFAEVQTILTEGDRPYLQELSHDALLEALENELRFLGLRIGSLKHFSRRAASPASPRALAGRPARQRRPRWSGLQPGRARWSATLAGAGQASQDGVG